MQESVGSSQCGPSWMQECPACIGARADGLHSWMHHLISDHVLPTEWPSDRVAKLAGSMAQKPYTAITESKKKRKKDSIPRPLNSFMIFAQHIRRNVLRVFSDASNSVISRQLGDLWRTVPRAYRNLYDEEANRLVKIHQMEYPDYKYQPKKRQHHQQQQQPPAPPLTQQQQQQPTFVASGCNNVPDLGQSNHWTSPPIRPATPSDGTLAFSSDNFNNSEHPLATSQQSLSLRSTAFQQHLCIKSEDSQSTRTTEEFTFSPAKCDESASLFTKCTSKRQRWESSGGRVENVKTSSLLTGNGEGGSFSTVLPPLLTSSSAKIYYDSAYASGINSSSSSSASSPAIGDVSPNKSMAMYSSKASPTRRRFHFIPIRPRSQQGTPLSGPQPVVRQRFLSANNDYTLSATYEFTPSPLASSPESPTGSGAGEKTAPLVGFKTTDTHDRVLVIPGVKSQPASVQTASEKCGSLGQPVNTANRRIVIANPTAEPLPPSGRLVQLLRQPDGGTGNTGRQTSFVNCRSQLIRQEKEVDHVKTVLLIPASIPSDVSRLETVHNHGVQRSPAVELTPTPYRTDRLVDACRGRNELRMALVASNPTKRMPSDMVLKKEEQLVYQVSSDEKGNRVVVAVPDEPCVLGVADSSTGLLDGANSVLVDGIVTDWWPTGTQGVESDVVDGMGDGTASINPSDFNVPRQEQESDQVIVISSPSSDGSASPSNEKTLVNADPVSDIDEVDSCSFDLLMNSIDISNFLPDPFPMTPSCIDQNGLMSDPEVDMMTLPGINYNPSIPDDAFIPELGTGPHCSPTVCHGCSRKSGWPRRLNSSDAFLDRRARGQAFASTNDQYNQSRPGQGGDRHADCREHSRQTHEESPLSDLDALDKSSLFPLKPDWSVVA